MSDQEIAQGIESLFLETNPNSFTSFNELILRLQSKLGFDLSHKLDFIRAHITFIFNAPPQLPPVQHPNVVDQRGFYNQQQQQQQHVGSGHSYFPKGPTEISFALPGTVNVADAPLSSPKDSRPKRRGGSGGLNKLCGVSPQLQTIVGQPAMPRTEIVKQLWAYIRKNNLQDPSNKRKIICNDELRLLFEVDSTDMFQMNKLLTKHILSLDPTKVVEQPAKKARVEESDAPSAEPAASEPAAPEPAAAAAAPASAPVSVSASASVTAPTLISEALSKFLGTSEKEMPQSEVYNRIEEYIKTEGLEDHLNSMVICDTKLQELLGCESIPTPGIRDALARSHLFPRA